MLAEETWNLPTVLVVGARQLLLDNLRVLLRTLGFRCVIGASLKEARALVDKEKPYAALLDQQLLKSTTAEILAVDRKSTRLNSSHVKISYAVFCLKKKKNKINEKR